MSKFIFILTVLFSASVFANNIQLSKADLANGVYEGETKDNVGCMLSISDDRIFLASKSLILLGDDWMIIPFDKATITQKDDKIIIKQGTQYIKITLDDAGNFIAVKGFGGFLVPSFKKTSVKCTNLIPEV